MSLSSPFVVSLFGLILGVTFSIRSAAGDSATTEVADSTQGCVLCFYQPDNMAFDAQNNIYLVDTDHKHRSRILKLTPEGQVLADWRVFTDGPGTNNGPNGIAIDNGGNIYVPDGGAQQMLKLSPMGKIIATFGKASSTVKDDYWHVAVDPTGNVYVVEFGRNLIQEFTSDGKLAAKWHREHGLGSDQWRNPQTIAIGKNDTLVVDDWGNDRIEVLSRTGENKLIFRGAGAMNEGLISSSGACTDSAGNIYVADYQRNRIKEYDFRGHLFNTIKDDRKPRLFEHAPFSIACGRDGNLYSADGLSVIKYTKDGVLLARWR
ncbi:MAG TPA: NHL repeat-containing protein [Gammaproteobacteria bacterium]|nr:NHL repeat-containing protein [Gammaproteobacteria bacterium]